MIQFKEFKMKEIKMKEIVPGSGLNGALKSMKERCIMWGGVSILFVVACALDYIEGKPLPSWWFISWQIFAFALIMFCCWRIWQLMKSVRQQQIFTSKNASIIESVGSMIDLFGLFTVIFGRHLSESHLEIGIVMILSGVFIQFVSHLIRAGIAMQKEQDLTI